MKKSTIAIDLGGTTLKGAIVDIQGNITASLRIPTNAAHGGQAVLITILSLIEQLLAQKSPEEEIIGVGIGTPGSVNGDGIITSVAVNIPGWKGMNILLSIRERFGLASVAHNDVSLMALAESRFGAGVGAGTMLFFALGTGIGGGIMIDGKLYTGKSGFAGEFGHLIVEPNGILCPCGQNGCVERYASANGIVAMAQEVAQRWDVLSRTPFVNVVLADPEGLTAEKVYSFVGKNDRAADEVHSRASEMLARAIGLMINALAPDIVVLGGGVMASKELILSTVRSYLPDCCIAESLDNCRVTASALGENTGVIGAAVYGFEKLL